MKSDGLFISIKNLSIAIKTSLIAILKQSIAAMEAIEKGINEDET